MLVRDRSTNARLVRGGYSLVEILVVVAIIVVLASIGGYYFLPMLDQSREDADLIQMKSLTGALQSYKIDKGDWPPSLDALLQPKTNGQPYVENQSQLMSKARQDQPYHYDASGANNKGTKPDISITTTDGRVIGNWMDKIIR